MKYEVVIQNPTNAYILNKDTNRIVTLCSTKRPDLGHAELLELVKTANARVDMTNAEFCELIEKVLREAKTEKEVDKIAQKMISFINISTELTKRNKNYYM